MAYSDDVLALSPDHIWSFDGDLLDSVGALNATGTGLAVGAQITEDAIASTRSVATTDRIDLVGAATVDETLSRKAIGGWISISAIQPPPKSIYREGSTGSQFCFVCWAGNALMLDIVNNGAVTQLFGSRTLAPGRTFHIFAKVEGTGFGDLAELYLDGVLVDSSIFGAASLADRAVGGEWSDPSGATEVGNQTVLLNGLVNCDYAYWASWGDKILPTADEIREELFEKGALPSVTIVSDTQANMQAALDALSGTVRGDEPLNIRIEDVISGGVLNLSANNITHDPLSSIHVQFVGTGTLNYTNLNGSNASIGSTPNNGTLNFINPAVLTVGPLIENSEVRILDSGTINEVAGIENSGTSFQTTISVSTVDVIVANNEYEFVRINGIDMTQGDVSVPISQVFDRQYRNP